LRKMACRHIVKDMHKYLEECANEYGEMD
jgi:hypothetical protein